MNSHIAWELFRHWAFWLLSERPSQTGTVKRPSAQYPPLVAQSHTGRLCIDSREGFRSRSGTGDWYNVSTSCFGFLCSEKPNATGLLKCGRFIWIIESTIYGLRIRRIAAELPFQDSCHPIIGRCEIIIVNLMWQSRCTTIIWKNGSRAPALIYQPSRNKADYSICSKRDFRCMKLCRE